jgi:peptidyl-prolyl cis-trans isomerase D
MLAATRRFAKSPAAAVLIGVLVVAFAAWGLNDVFRAGGASDFVVKTGSRTISSADFRREYDNYKKRLETEAGQRLTPEIVDANGLDRGLLNGLATRESFAELLHKVGIRASDKLIATEVGKIPAFLNPVSGQFDKTSYEKALGAQGMTPPMFEQILRDELGTQHFATSMVNGLDAPRAYGALGAVYGLETRDVTLIQVTPQSITQPTAPTDAQLTAFMKENAARLTRPEMRVLTIVRFSPAAVPAGPVDEAEVKKLYDFRKDTFSTPETRTVIQIPTKDAASAQKAAAQLASGAAPAAVAKSLGVDAITYEAKPKTAFPDRRIAEAAFAATAGQILPVQGELGGAVIQVVSIKAGRTVSLEEARPMLEAEARKNAAAEKAYALSQAYDEAHQAGSSLPDAAQKAGVPTTTIGPVTQQGMTLQGQPTAGVPPQLLEIAFGLPSGGESDLTDAGDGEYFAVRVEKVIPSALPALAEVRPQLAQAWMLRETASRMEARANELSARVNKGESMDAVAQSAGLRVVRVSQVSRQNAGQMGFGGEIAGRAFNAKPGETFVSPTPQFGYAVGVVSNVKMETSPIVAMIAQQQRRQMAQTMFQEISEAAQQYARTSMKTKTDINRARAAIGLEPLTTTTATKGGAAKK